MKSGVFLFPEMHKTQQIITDLDGAKVGVKTVERNFYRKRGGVSEGYLKQIRGMLLEALLLTYIVHSRVRERDNNSIYKPW